MKANTDGIEWNPKVSQASIRRLYETDARGVLDAELIDEVGFALYARCQSTLIVAANEVQCPHCDQVFATGWHWHKRYDMLKIRCPQCQAWECTGRQYRESLTPGLAAGNAVSAFRAFVDRYPLVTTPRARMLLIDRLIHEFHYALSRLPDGSLGRNPLPNETTANNLIEGGHDAVVRFLEDLTYRETSTPELRATDQAWRAAAEHMKQRRATRG